MTSNDEIKRVFAVNVQRYRAEGKTESFIASYTRKFWEVDDRLRGRRP